jgi:hypothetical protein
MIHPQAVDWCENHLPLFDENRAESKHRGQDRGGVSAQPRSQALRGKLLGPIAKIIVITMT